MSETEAWIAHEAAQRAAWAALTPAARLRWLWQAKCFAARAQAAARLRQQHALEADSTSSRQQE
jgi:hypothetical protein